MAYVYKSPHLKSSLLHQVNTSVKTSPTEGRGKQRKKTSSSEKPRKRNYGWPWRKVCPIAGCKSKPQVKPSNHFDSAHKDLTPEKRALYLETAKKIPRHEKKKPVLCTRKGQPTLEQLVRPPTPLPSEEEEVGTEDVGIGKRSFPRYSRSESTLMSFESFLTNMDGNQRSTQVSAEIATDVYLKFACRKAALPDWERLLDRDMLIAYMDKCKHYNVAADGRISKLEALDAGLTFMSRSLFKDDPRNTTFQRTMHEDG